MLYSPNWQSSTVMLCLTVIDCNCPVSTNCGANQFVRDLNDHQSLTENSRSVCWSQSLNKHFYGHSCIQKEVTSVELHCYLVLSPSIPAKRLTHYYLINTLKGIKNMDLWREISQHYQLEISSSFHVFASWLGSCSLQTQATIYLIPLFRYFCPSSFDGCVRFPSGFSFLQHYSVSRQGRQYDGGGVGGRRRAV